MKEISDILTKEEIKELEQEGYTPLEIIGEGNTRHVVEVLYKKGDFQEKRVIKIPKNEDEIDENSICTLINLSKGDPNRKELVCASDIGYHPNVIKVIDNIKLDGKIANIEEYLSGRSLEKLIKDNGPFAKRENAEDKKLFEQIIKGIIKGVSYLNEDKKKLHRDIKPSNIIVSWDGETRITDLQNATQIKELPSYELLPTRGGTACTHPKLLNAVVNGKKTCANKKTELYAIGSTIYYTLTGRYPFNYNIVYDNNGTEIDLGDKKIKITLRNNGNELKEITNEDHKKELKKSLKAVPWQYRKLLGRCLSLDDKFKEFSLFGDISGKYSIHQLEKDFEKASKSKRQLVLEQIRKKGPWVLLSMLIAGIAGWGIGTAINRANTVETPTLQQLLVSREYDHLPIKEFNMDKEAVKEYLKNDIIEVKEKLQQYNKKDIKKLLGDAHFVTTRSIGVDERLLNALILSCVLEDKEIRNKFADEEKRINPTLVPNNFVLNCIDMNPYYWTDEKHLNSYLKGKQKTLWAAKYLMQNYAFGDDVADVFAKYFCSREEMAIAMQNTGTYHYFPSDKNRTVAVGMSGMKMQSNGGYGSEMPQTEKRFINRALALYFIMDKEGNFTITDPSKD